MYIPPPYKQNNSDAIVDFMNRFSFGILVTAPGGLPVATHLPFVIDATQTEIKLLSHVARPNLQWHDFPSEEVLVIFSEPHAYISPSHYEQAQNVPTWNYMAVHAYGKARMVEDAEGIKNILEQTINTYEPAYLDQWKSLPETYHQKMIRGIVAFEITVTNLQAKEKLSQNKKETERRKIADTLLNSQNSNEKMVGDYMMKRNNFSVED